MAAKDRRCTVGIDFGTESARAAVFDTASGEMLGMAVCEYTNGVIDDRLPECDVRLEPDWALQDPEDYLRAVREAVPAAVREAKVTNEEVIGIGIDFTACTMMPVTGEGLPLCSLPRWRRRPHAWVKLWKHHAAQPEADLVNETAQRLGLDFLKNYGGRISSEWFFPKALQILHEDPEVYRAADRLIEAQDWVIWMLTGRERRSAGVAGYKAIWQKGTGFPPQSFFKALHPEFESIVERKMAQELLEYGKPAGGLSAEAASWTGLLAGTPVAVANMDAHVSVPACTVIQPGRMVMIMGTSICHLVLGSEKRIVEGMCGAIRDGVIPGFWGFEAGQSCVGDHFAWFVENGVPASLRDEAKAAHVSIHELLERKAAQLRPGESGLIALDWWNGNRSVLVDADVTGLLLGMTLQTKPEDIFRALIEATAFGTRVIIDSFVSSGVPVDELIACGGLPDKNKLLMQLFSTITRNTVRVAASSQTPALGAAMFAAVAAGSSRGGHDTIEDASRSMAHLRGEVYNPVESDSLIYDELYREYLTLHDHFGRGQNDVMKRMKRLKERVRTSN